MIRVIKRSGQIEKLDIRKIQKYTCEAVEDLKNVSQSELEVDANLQFQDMMSSADIQETLIKTAVDKIDVDRPDWTFVASRLFLYDLYHKVGRNVGGIKGKSYFHLSRYFEVGEREGRILLGLKDKYDLDDLNNYIQPQRDLQFNYLGIRTLSDRYLLKDREGKPIELPQHLFMGVAMFLAQNESDCQMWAKKFYDILSKFEVMAATPTLSNARTPRHQLSSCFIKGTKVRTIQGYKDIDKIEEGDLVLTHKNRFMSVYELLKRDYEDELIVLNINGLIDDLSATKEHPVLSIKKDDIKCIRKLGSCIKSQGKNKRCFKLKREYKDDCHFLNKKFGSKWNEIDDLNIGDFVSISYPKNIYKSVIYISDYVKIKNIIIKNKKIMFKRSSNSFYSCERSFLNNQIKPVNNKIELSKDFMRLVGYFLAEGHIAKDRSSITFTFGSKETLYIQDTKNILERVFDINVNITENRDNSTNISVHSKIIGLFFDKLVGTAFNKKILNIDLLFSDPEVQKELLIGVIRGDGCALKEGYQLTLSNKKLIQQLFEISLRCGLSPYLKIDAKKHKGATVKASHLKIGVNNDKEFILSVNKNIEHINFNSKASSTLRYFWFENEYFMKIIEKNKRDIKEEVYNIEVEEDHSYCVSGVNVHNCYIGSTSDNIEGIFDAYKEMALLSKFGGGIGWDWSQVRGMGSYIDGHKQAAGGIVPFLKITNDVAIAVDQLGTRKGAIAVYIEPWHIDVRDFLDLKKNSGEERRRAHDLFPALWLNDLFMKRVQADTLWTLFDPYEVSELTNLYGEEFEKRYLELEKSDNDIIRDTISAKGLWKEILRSYFETGNPFLTFKDTANRSNPNKHAGIIRSSNLCVTGDTRLHTQLGLVKAKDLEENYDEIVASYDLRTDGSAMEYGVSTAKALKMFKTKENADIYEVSTKDGYKIKSTLWHEYYVENGKEVVKKSLENILVGEKLLIQSDVGQFGQEGSADLGFLMGIVTGDGTFSYKASKGHSIIHIDLYNEDMNLGNMIHRQIKNIISSNYALLENSYKEDFENVYPQILQHTKNSQKLRFSNIRLGRIFDEQFNFNKERKLQVPEVIFKGTKACVKAYLQGLFIADGTINILRNDSIPTFAIQLASIEKTLLEEVQILLSNFGIRSKISKMRDIEKGVFSYITVNNEARSYDSKPLYRLNINGNNAIKFIDDIGFIGAKQTKALNVLTERQALGYPRKSRKSEKFFVEISDIKYIGKEDVYDTTQLYNHSLIFNGLVTGNCTEIFQNTSPNHYKIKLTFNDGTVETFEEDEMITVDNGSRKPAKKITALDSLNGKQIWMVDKEQSDGETAVCNLASINLSKVHTKEKLSEVIPTAIRMLDNVIDLNFYPLAKVKKTNQKTRAIGLGVMGEAQMLAESQIEWGSEEHFYKIDEVMESVSYYAINSSSDLSLEKGHYPNYKGSDWEKGLFPIDHANKEACNIVHRDSYTHNWLELKEKVSRDGMRNGYLMAVAPTSSISILTGTTQAIEPIYKRKWFEENLSGLIPVVAPKLSPETWEYYTPSYELNQNILVKAGAIRQKWIDQGQSLNIFISLDKASGRYLNEIYMNAWKYGLKSTYYLRSQSPEASNDIEDRSQECVGCQ